MNRRLAPLPCYPPDSPIRPPEQRKRPPVGRRREASSKYLIYMALSSITGSDLSAESMIRLFARFYRGQRATSRADRTALMIGIPTSFCEVMTDSG